MTKYEVAIEQFSGPMEKLLELIEDKELEITTVNLAEVTASFLNHVKDMGEEVESAILSDFLVVASQLVLIKSKVLLPSLELTEEEETSIHDLEERLKIYKEFKRAAEHVDGLWNKKTISLSRPLFLTLGDTPVFYPPKELDTQDFVNSMNKLLATLQELLPGASKKIKTTVISLEAKMKELVGRLQEAAHSFRSLAKTMPKQEIVVMFLAILHLLRDKVIQVEQKDHLSDMVIKKS